MTPERWKEIDELAQSALERADDERAAFLAEACAGDEALRREVESQIVYQQQASKFLEEPAFKHAAASMADSQTETESMEGRTISHYSIVRKLGAGGMGEVYLAQDTTLSRKVAIKFLSRDSAAGEQGKKRLVREARAVAGLDHPHICAVHEVGEEAGYNFIVMQYVEGETLASRIQRQPIEVREVLEIAVQIADALAEAHSHGIVHRDVKPQNVMLTASGQVKVVDFGLARVVREGSLIDGAGETESVLSVPGLVIGTVNYMSPEQVRAEELDSRSDIFSFGVVLYEMLSGRHPFQAESAGATMSAILTTDPAPLVRFASDTPDELQRIVGKALVKDKEGRHQGIKELLIDLRKFRQDLDFEAKLDPSTGLDFRDRATNEGDSGAGRAEAGTASKQVDRTGDGLTERTTSSTRIIIREIRRHRRGALLALAGLILVVAGVVVGIKYIGWNPVKTKQSESFTKIKLARLTTNGKASGAAISPEGKYVVHVMGSAGQQSLWLRHIATGSDKEIVPTTGGDILGATFTGDGNYIYFTREDALDSVLYQVPVLGGAAKRSGADIDTVITLSPDDKRFAFIRGYPEYGETVLMVASADGTGEQRLVTHKTGYFRFVKPAWSPDGEMIAAASRRPEAEVGNETIITVRVTDGAEKVITSQRWTEIGAIAWLADGSGLIITAADEETEPAKQIWHIAYPSGEARRITNDTNDYRGISLTADSSSFVTVQTETISNIWVAPDRDVSHATQVTSNNNDGSQGLAWMPDGRIVFESRASGNHDLWVTNADGTNQKQLTTEAGSDSWPLVTPDGRYILFESNRVEGRHSIWRIWRMGTDGTHARPLTVGDYQPASDSQSVFYTSRINGKSSLMRVSVDGGTPAQLTDYASMKPLLSPDGKQLACIFVDTQTLVYRIGILGLEGGVPVKVLDLQRPSLFQSLRWTPDGRALAYIDTRAGVSNLWRLPLDGSPRKQITDFKTDQIFQFDWSRDGRWLALARGSVTSDVVLVRGSK